MANGEGDISGLPKVCMAIIFSFTSPRDACRSSSVSLAFKAAADSDFVWEKFLPSDYKEMINAAVNPLKRNLKLNLKLNRLNSKKKIYFWLCDHPVFLDGGNKSLNIEKKSGKKCMMIGAKELRIVWGDTPRYWTWISHPHSRFSQVAKLEKVWRFEIDGKVDTRMLSPRTTYAVYFVIKFLRVARGLADAPTRVSVQFAEGGGSASGAHNVYLDPKGNQYPHPVWRGDRWMEIELGEFYNYGGEDGEVEMSLKEVAGHLKSGLIVEGIELRPKEANGKVDIFDLPEVCMAIIFSFTSPRDACRSSSVSPAFKVAADSDFVWEKFLPSDYKEIINAAVDPLELNRLKSKKELYFWLCDHPVFLDGGNKSLNIEKKSGKKCMMIGAKELRIVLGDNPRDWSWKSHPDSRFSQVAKLEHLWQFKIDGRVDPRMLSPMTTYAVYFVIKFVPGGCCIALAPTNVSVQFAEGGGSASGARKVYLDPRFKDVPRPVERGDGWMEIELGEFYNYVGDDGEVEISLTEVAGALEYRLIVEGIELRPKE